MKNLTPLLTLLIGIAIGALWVAGKPTLFAAGNEYKRCDYTYIVDQLEPEIGQDGRVTYDRAWSVILGKRFRFKAKYGDRYFFERCD